MMESQQEDLPQVVPDNRKKSNHSVELSDFLIQLDNYKPTFPAPLSNYYLERSGLDVKDERILKLVSLSCDKLISEVLFEAKQLSSLKQQQSNHGKNKKRKNNFPEETIEIDDLQMSLTQLRIFLRRKVSKAEDNS